MVKFKEIKKGITQVHFNGKFVGSIVKVVDGYHYRPKGTKANQWGDVFVRIDDCKDSLLN